MSEKQLNDLPEEILLQVFDKMDFKTLMKSSIVCRKWNEMIEGNSAIIEKIELVVDLEKNREFPEKFTRNYRSIKIYGNYCEFNWKLLDCQASRLRNLETYCRTFIINEVKTNFNKFLASMTNLETLRIFGYSDYDIDLSHHNHLKKLDLESCNHCGILKFPGTAQLTYLSLKNYSSKLNSFLSRQKCLEDLTIHLDDRINTKINLKTLQAIQFPLKKLSMYNNKWLGSEENLLLFMNKFVNTLEELEIITGFPASVYKLIFNKFHKLKTLEVSLDDAPKERSFYMNLRPNLSVQKLNIFDVDRSVELTTELQIIKGFIGKLPNLQILVLFIKNLPNEIMMFIASHLKMLKEFYVNDLSDDAFDEVNIPSLKTIIVLSLYDKKPQDWKKVVRAMPNIEEFIIEEFDVKSILKEENIKIISEGWPKLKHVTFGDGFKARKEIFEQFLQNCKDLKTVVISKKAFESDSEKEEILREVKRDGFQFIVNDY